MKKVRLSLLLVILLAISFYGQVNTPVLTDNKMKTFIDSAVNKAATIYLQDSITKGISIGVYIKGSNTHIIMVKLKRAAVYFQLV